MLFRMLIMLLVGAVVVWVETELFLTEWEMQEDKRDLEKKWIILQGGWWF